MPKSYVISQVAEHDIADIVDYLVQNNLQAAYDFVDALYDSFDKLVENPYLGHMREDLTHHPARFWPFKWHYSIIYDPTAPLKIVRVLSGLRNIPNLLRCNENQPEELA